LFELIKRTIKHNKIENKEEERIKKFVRKTLSFKFCFFLFFYQLSEHIKRERKESATNAFFGVKFLVFNRSSFDSQQFSRRERAKETE
jgi:hypothetical protein